MPIFEKSEKRIYFAHIPKTGGTSIYSAFVEAGWVVKNLYESPDPRSTFATLKARYGVNHISQEGRMFRYPHSPQHAPHIIWRTWGPFEASFAITRNPMTRLLSSLRWHHRMRRRKPDFQEHAKTLLRAAQSRPWKPFTLLDGHLIPQHYFVGPTTEIFHFEGNWSQQLSSRFGVNAPPEDNKAPDGNDALCDEWIAFAKWLYKHDFRLFGYSESNPPPKDHRVACIETSGFMVRDVHAQALKHQNGSTLIRAPKE